MTLQEYNDLYKMPLLKSMTITTSGGITITNANIVSENMSLEKSLCSENNLRYGRCEAACFTIRIADLNHDFTGEWLNVIQDVVTDSEGYLLTQNNQYLLTEDGYRIKLKDEEIDEATAPYGRFKVYSDKPENDRRWRVLTCYDQMFDILNADVLAWYNTLTFPMTIKNLRDSFFSYLGITQVAKTLVNDNFSTPGGFAVSGELSGKTVIESICELNGVFGQMTADGKFDYVSLTDAEELTFDYYVDGTGSYEDYVTDVITGINIKGTSNDVGITVGTTDNLYVISSNPLVYGTEGTTALTDALTALLNHISSDSFRPFKVTTYGNPMLPLGTKVTLNTKNKTIISYVIKKKLTGIQNLKDEVSATGDKHQATNVNSPKSEIFRTQGKVHELEINVDGLTSRVSATETNLQNNYSTTQQMNSAITQSAENITTQVSNTYVTQSAYNAEVQNLQDQIDGRIEYFDGNVIPTLNNPPANSWTTTSAKDSHVGDLYRYHYTQSGVEKTDYYRFDKDTSTSPATFSWVALGESEVDEALRQAELANQKADAAQAQLDSLEQNVEDNYYTKTQTNSAINQSATAITQSVSSTYETKSDSTNKFNTANTNAQGYANDAKNAANAATDTKLQSYYTKSETNSQIQQTATSITQSVSSTYTTKTDFNNLSIGGRNLFKQTTDYWKSRTLLGNDNESFTLNGDGISVTADNVCDAIALGLKENDIIQISFDIKFSSDFAPVSGQTQAQRIQGSCNFGGSWSGLAITGGTQENEILNIIYSDTREGHINTYLKVPSKMVDGTTSGKFYLNIRFNYWTGTVYLKNVMIEKATKPSSWSPAPEDSLEYADGVGASTLSTANANAQGYANDALEEAKIYTNAQIEVTSESITSTVEREINGIQIGSENYLLDSQKMSDWPVGNRTTKNTSEDFTTLSLNGSSAEWSASFRTGKTLPLELLDGSPWMLSFEYSCTSNITTMLINVNGTSASPGNIAGRTKYTAFLPENYNELPSTNGEWKRVIFRGKNLTPSMLTSGSGDVYSWCMEIYNRTNEVPLMIRKLKLERGNKATDWNPAPEDLENYADAVGTSTLSAANAATDQKLTNYSTKSEVTQLANKIVMKVDGNGNIVQVALSADPSTGTAFTVSANNIDFIADGNIQLTSGTIGIYSTNFQVTSDGTVTAKAGQIGGWKITSTQFYDAVADETGTTQGAGICKYGEGYAFWAGTSFANRNNAPLLIGHNGTLRASNAIISGKVTSSDLTVTGGSINLGSGVFRVENNGAVTCSNLTATGGSIGGLSVSTNGVYYQRTSSSYCGFTSTEWPLFINASSRTNPKTGVFRVSGIGSTVARDITLTNDSGSVAEISNSSKIWINSSATIGSMLTMYDLSGSMFLYASSGSSTPRLSISGNFSASGTKSRVVDTPDYGEILLYCYETPTPMFGDVGEGKIAEDGKCYVWLDSTFSETIKTESYQVFLQKYGQGECYVTERTSRYFVVEGDAGMRFGWELKARQAGYENDRLESFIEEEEPMESYDYPTEAIRHIEAIQNGREVA